MSVKCLKYLHTSLISYMASHCSLVKTIAFHHAWVSLSIDYWFQIPLQNCVGTLGVVPHEIASAVVQLPFLVYRWKRSCPEEDLLQMGELPLGEGGLSYSGPLCRPSRWLNAHQAARGPVWRKTGGCTCQSASIYPPLHYMLISAI